MTSTAQANAARPALPAALIDWHAAETKRRQAYSVYREKAVQAINGGPGARGEYLALDNATDAAHALQIPLYDAITVMLNDAAQAGLSDADRQTIANAIEWMGCVPIDPKDVQRMKAARSAAESILSRAPATPQSEQVDVEAIMTKIPTVARLYYTGIGARRYRRASTMNGPGEPLVHRSHVERELKLLATQSAQPAEPSGDETDAYAKWYGSLGYPPSIHEAFHAGSEWCAAQSGQRAGVAEDARDAARWRAIEPYLGIDDVGDEDFIYGLVVYADHLEEDSNRLILWKNAGEASVGAAIDAIAAAPAQEGGK